MAIETVGRAVECRSSDLSASFEQPAEQRTGDIGAIDDLFIGAASGILSRVAPVQKSMSHDVGTLGQHDRGTKGRSPGKVGHRRPIVPSPSSLEPGLSSPSTFDLPPSTVKPTC